MKKYWLKIKEMFKNTTVEKPKNSCTISTGGFGALFLTVLFFCAKIFGYINWSWWLVFAPLWLGPALVIVFFVLYIIALVLAECLDPMNKYRK